MIFSTYFITYLCFPSIIIFKKLPGGLQKGDEDQRVALYKAAMVGIINVGVFYLSASIGAILATCWHRSETMSNTACILVTILKLFISGTVIYLVLYQEADDPIIQVVCLVTMFTLGLLHSFVATHF